MPLKIKNGSDRTAPLQNVEMWKKLDISGRSLQRLETNPILSLAQLHRHIPSDVKCTNALSLFQKVTAFSTPAHLQDFPDEMAR